MNLWEAIQAAMRGAIVRIGDERCHWKDDSLQSVDDGAVVGVTSFTAKGPWYVVQEWER